MSRGEKMFQDNGQDDPRPTFQDPTPSKKMQTSQGWRGALEGGTESGVTFRFGRNHIKEARLQRGLSQRELARRCNIANSNLCELETGKRKPWLKAIKNICRELGFSPEALFPCERRENADRI